MKKLSQISGRSYFVFFNFLSAIILFIMAFNFPVNVDEILHQVQAEKVVSWYFSSGEDIRSIQKQPDNLIYYGQSVDNLAHLIYRVFDFDDEFIVRHFVGAFISWLLLLVCGLLIKELSGNYILAMLTMFMLFISPRPFGQSIGNLKDIPFALGYTWSVLALIKLIKHLPKIKLSTAISFALGVAFANSIRMGGIVLIPYFFLFLLVWLLLNKEHFTVSKCAHFIKFSILIIAIGYFGSLIFWPYGLQNPIKHPIESLKMMSHYSIAIRQIFEGKLYWSLDLPWYYVIKMMLITIPEIVLVGLMIFVVLFFVKIPKLNNKTIPFLIIIFAAIFPVFYVILIKANLYSGWRQMYFIYPSILVIAMWALSRLYLIIKEVKLKIAFVCFTIILTSFPIIHLVKTYPANYVYFNALVGGNKNAWSNYEYDYYFHGMKNACEWLNNNNYIPDGATVASSIDLLSYFDKGKKIKWKYIRFQERYNKKWDYAILSNNYVHPWQLKNETWIPKNSIKTFYHKDQPYITILKWDGDDIIKAHDYIKTGDVRNACLLYENALQKDVNNVNLMALIGKCYFDLGEYEKLDKLMQKGYQIHPFYEPFYLLQANVSFEMNEFEKALLKLENLFSFNPRYQKALPLLVECYEKTGNSKLADKYRRFIKNK